MTRLVDERPPSADTPDWSFPAVRRATLPGVEVVAAHLPARPLVEVVALVRHGAIADPAGLEGAAATLGEAVLRGAGGRDQHELAVAFERVGAVPGVTTRYERTELSVEVPAGLLFGAVGLLAEVLRDPTLAPAEVERVRDARVDRIRSRLNHANQRAGRAAQAALFAPTSRFTLPSSGDVEQLLALDPADVGRLHARRWADAAVTLVLVGDLDGVDLEQVAAPLSAGAGDTAVATTTDDIAPGGARVLLADVSGAVQSVLRLVAPGPRVDEVDDAALEVGQTALFSSFSSRVNMRLREELGYTYGASGGFTRLRDGGWMTVGCSVRTEVTADAVSELVGVLRGTLDEGLTDEETAQARANLVQRFPVRYDGPSAVAAALVRRAHRDLADDERDEHLAALREVSARDATDALRESLQLDAVAVVVAGNGDEVEGLAELGLGPVVPEPNPPAT